MKGIPFPNLELERWRESRDILHTYAKVLGKVRRTLSPAHKHWWHVTLQVGALGLTTTPMPADARNVELILDLNSHRLRIHTSDGAEEAIPLAGLSQARLAGALSSALDSLGIDLPLRPGDFDDSAAPDIDLDSIRDYWRTLVRVDSVFKEFKASLREETSPVQLFPHHFDLSLNWFSGRLVEGHDAGDAESADEQMTFGFVSGDAGIEEPYFYATAYPEPAGFTEALLPAPAYWHSAGFSGAVLRYERLRGVTDPGGLLLRFLNETHEAGRRLMR